MELSRAQDIEAGDGTTSVVVVAGALLDASEKLLQKGIHPTVISDGFQKALQLSLQVLFLYTITSPNRYCRDMVGQGQWHTDTLVFHSADSRPVTS